ncbi:MAG: hypothetical protein JWM56_1107 [Candidatus Peribacteria bacterium]|nr:hypothetical protein [Candidatus Peribacteria bacterium]
MPTLTKRDKSRVRYRMRRERNIRRHENMPGHWFRMKKQRQPAHRRLLLADLWFMVRFFGFLGMTGGLVFTFFLPVALYTSRPATMFVCYLLAVATSLAMLLAMFNRTRFLHGGYRMPVILVACPVFPFVGWLFLEAKNLLWHQPSLFKWLLTGHW